MSYVPSAYVPSAAAPSAAAPEGAIWANLGESAAWRVELLGARIRRGTCGVISDGEVEVGAVAAPAAAAELVSGVGGVGGVGGVVCAPAGRLAWLEE